MTWMHPGGADVVRVEMDGDRTWFTLIHERLADDAQCEDHRRGWTDGTDSLERYVA